MTEKSWNHTRNQKKATFLQVINEPIICTFFKNFTNHRRKTSRALVFSNRLFSNILKYGDHRENIEEHQTDIEEFS